VSALDTKKTYINALTSLTPNCAKIPIHFDSDREAISMALGSLAMADPSTARIVRIADTLTLDRLEISEEVLGQRAAGIEAEGDAGEMKFDEAGNLASSLID
jgi:hypothetical protein